MQKKKKKQCNDNHFLDLSLSSLMGIWNAPTLMSGYDFFNSIRPDPGFVSPVRSDPSFVSPIRSGPVRSGPVRSGPVRSDPGFVNGQ